MCRVENEITEIPKFESLDLPEGDNQGLKESYQSQVVTALP
jgi:hypothetical protein